jgi:DNA-binding LacI/PurR family transcriptional regulator
MAGTAVRLVLNQEPGEEPDKRSVELATSLVVRETTVRRA